MTMAISGWGAVVGALGVVTMTMAISGWGAEVDALGVVVIVMVIGHGHWSKQLIDDNLLRLHVVAVDEAHHVHTWGDAVGGNAARNVG